MQEDSKFKKPVWTTDENQGCVEQLSKILPQHLEETKAGDLLIGRELVQHTRRSMFNPNQQNS